MGGTASGFPPRKIMGSRENSSITGSSVSRVAGRTGGSGCATGFRSAAVIDTSGTNSSRSRTTTCAMAPAAPRTAMRMGLLVLVRLDVGRGLVDFLECLLEGAEDVVQELIGNVERGLDAHDLGVGQRSG